MKTRCIRMGILVMMAVAATLAVRAADGQYAAGVDFTPYGWSVLFGEFFRSLDVVAFVLVTLTIVLIGMGVDLFSHLRIGRLIPEGLLAEVQEEMANGEYEKALELSEKSDSLIGQIFSAALSKTDYSYDRMEGALRGEADIQALVWRQWVGQFKILAVAGPLAGLVGALVNAMRLVSDLTGRPDFGLALASSFEMRSLLYNICTSLILGLGMSIISLIVYGLASSKLEKVLVEARRLGEELLDPFRPLPVAAEG